MEKPRIKCEIHDGIAEVMLTRGDKLNALDRAMFSAIDETLASGYLDDTLTVTDADGVAQVLPVLDSEPISHLVEGLEAVGGSANVFVHTSAGVVALSVVEYKPNEKE